MSTSPIIPFFKAAGNTKPAQNSINDSDGFRLRAACVCVRSHEEKEVLLVSSSRGAGWIIPGGKVEKGEVDSQEVAAGREAWEEAGVVGKLGRYLGEFENIERGHRTKVYVMYVDRLEPEEAWEESRRARKWFKIAEAHEVLSDNKPNHAKYLDKLIQTQPRV